MWSELITVVIYECRLIRRKTYSCVTFVIQLTVERKKDKKYHQKKSENDRKRKREREKIRKVEEKTTKETKKDINILNNKDKRMKVRWEPGDM